MVTFENTCTLLEAMPDGLSGVAPMTMVEVQRAGVVVLTIEVAVGVLKTAELVCPPGIGMGPM
jgi:hypothetical protein